VIHNDSPDEEIPMTTTDFDALQKRWQAQDARLDTMLELNRHMLHTLQRDQTRGALGSVFVLLWVQFAMDLLAVFLLGSFLGNRLGAWQSELRFMIPALVLFVCAIALFASVIRQLAMLYAIDASGPVSEVQRILDTLHAHRLIVTRAIILIAPMLWIPIAIVGLRALFDFLVINLIAGALFIPVVYWLSRRYGQRLLRYAWIARINEDLAGRSLSEARARLKEIATFQREG
jgi:hypothetical protein